MEIWGEKKLNDSFLAIKRWLNFGISKLWKSRKKYWRRKWQLTPVFLPGDCHGQRSLAATVHGVTRVGHSWATKPPWKKYSEWEFVKCSPVIPTVRPEEEGVLQGRGLHRTPMTSVSRGLSPGGAGSGSWPWGLPPLQPRGPCWDQPQKGRLSELPFVSEALGASPDARVSVCVWGCVHSGRNVCLCVYVLVHAILGFPGGSVVKSLLATQ